MADQPNLPSITTGVFELPPSAAQAAKNNKLSWKTATLEAKDPETTNIRSRPHHHRFSSQQKFHVPRRLRKPYVTKAKQPRNNTENQSMDHGNAPLTRDELFTTLAAPIVATMKLRNQETQKMLDEQNQRMDDMMKQQIAQNTRNDQQFETMMQALMLQSTKKSTESSTTRRHRSKQQTNHHRTTTISDTPKKIPIPEKTPTTSTQHLTTDPTTTHTAIIHPTTNHMTTHPAISHTASTHLTSTDPTTPDYTANIHPTTTTTDMTAHLTRPLFRALNGFLSFPTPPDRPRSNPWLPYSMPKTPTPEPPQPMPMLPRAHLKLLFRALDGFLPFPTPPDRPSRSNHSTRLSSCIII